jgi:LmbE family N-acetylglucosaminyl deacetylase|tara:strand:+ start:385 stop:1080 length:696 start_codon:yes stop_codon:yes gene_type:complete
MSDTGKIMIVAAHPDDEVLGCGGTVARLSMEGSDVYTIILGEGVTSRDNKRDLIKRKNEISELRKQVKSANKILGVKKVYTFDFPDNRFDTVPLLDIIKSIEKIKEDIKPNIVFTHHHGDLNIDHQITFKAVMTAFRPTKDQSVREIYSFEIPSSTEWSGPSTLTYFMPDYFVDVSKSLKVKINALKEYKTELGDFPHPRSLTAVELNAKQWGVKVGFEAAEAFKTIRIRK